MKNLKKVLALVLVIAMVMGFAVTASATEFSDAEEIAEQNQQAVNVLNALNIINGFPDGSYQPEESVTRAQVAKMIAVAFNNGDESINEQYQNVVCGLSDIGGNWAEGYIKYCVATSIMQGYPDGTFLPDQAVTGNELCQVMLNILGYELDTENTPWATAVMAKSSAIGLLKNTSSQVGSACPRQEAAQIIFNALTLPILKANALGVLVESDETILTKYLGCELLEDVVVTGNDKAALNDDQPLLDGKAELDNETVVVWDTETSLDDIGETFNVWVKNGTVIYEENTMSESQKEEYETGVRSLSASSSFRTNDDTAYYVNFANYAEGRSVAEATITYYYDGATGTGTYLTKAAAQQYLYDGLELALVPYYSRTSTSTIYSGSSAASTITAGTYYISNTVRVEDEVTDSDFEVIKLIFRNAENVLNGTNDNDGSTNGAVYCYTQNTWDTSDRVTLKEFDKYYTSEMEEVEFNSNENGNYVKITDVDGDGYADYYLKTKYTMAVVNDLTSGGTYTMSALDEDHNIVSTSSVVNTKETEIEEGSIVVYAPIDGIYYTNVATMVTDSIDSINISAESITCGETTYEQSGIDVFETLFNESFLNTKFDFYLVNAEKEVDYDFYLDNYGYVRAYNLNSDTNGLGLLTNAFYSTDGRRTDVYKVEMTTAEAETQDYTVNISRSDRAFFDTTESDNGVTSDNGDRNTWGRLEPFEGYVNGTKFKTNVTLYSGTADSLVVRNVGDSNMGYKQLELYLKGVTSTSNRQYTAYASDGTDSTVYATTDTVYYYVSGGRVTTWTGYNTKSVSISSSSAIAYTVAHQARSTDKYLCADVIVIEDQSRPMNAYLLYSIGNNSLSYRAQTVAEVDDVWTANQSLTGIKNGSDAVDPWFYTSTSDLKDARLTSGYTAYGIYASEVMTNVSVGSRNYIYLANNGTIYLDTTPIYAFNGAGTLSSVRATSIVAGDKVVYVYDGSSIGYAILINEDDATEKALYEAIKTDNETYSDETVTFYGVTDGQTSTGHDKDYSKNVQEIYVSYTQASEYMSKATNEALTVSGVQSYTCEKIVLGDGSKDQEYKLYLINNNGVAKTYTLKVLAKVPANSEKIDLDPDATKTYGIVLTEKDGIYTVTVGVDSHHVTIETLEQYLTSTYNSDIDLQGYDVKGNPVEDTDALRDTYKIIAKITSRDETVTELTIYPEQTTYTIQAQVTGEAAANASLTVDETTVTTSSGLTEVGEYNYGDEISVKISVPEYYAGTVSTTAGTLVKNTDGSYTLTVAGDATVTLAVAKDFPTIKVTTGVTGSLSAAKWADKANNGGDCLEKESMVANVTTATDDYTVTVTLATGYKMSTATIEIGGKTLAVGNEMFTETDGGLSGNNIVTFEFEEITDALTKDMVITLTPVKKTVTVSNLSSANVTVTPSNPVSYGATITITDNDGTGEGNSVYYIAYTGDTAPTTPTSASEAESAGWTNIATLKTYDQLGGFATITATSNIAVVSVATGSTPTV